MGDMTEADVVGILARSTDARKKEPVDGKLRAINTWSRKVRGNMRPKIKVRGNMVNFRPFFAHIPPQFELAPESWTGLILIAYGCKRPRFTPTVFRHADTLLS